MAELFDQENAVSTELVEHRASQPMDILIADIKDIDPEKARALMDMQFEWERNQAKKQYAVAMQACQEEMPTVIQNQDNSHTRSRYADLQAVQKTAKPVYSRHGFSLSFGEADCSLPNHKRTICDVLHDGGHEKRYYVDLPVDGTGSQGGKSSMNAVQGCISTTTYGQRRLLCMIFNITIAGEDDDAQSISKINEAQYATLEDWIELLKPTPFKLPPFLKWLNVSKLSEIAAADFNKAATELQAQARKHGVAK
jgi:hypothetical protein